MGGLCSRRSTEDGATSGSIPHVNGHFSYGSGMVYQSRGLTADVKSNWTPSPIGETTDKQPGEPFSFPELTAFSHGMNEDDINGGIPHLSRALSHKTRSAKSKQVAVAKVSEVSSLLGRAGTAGLGKAVEVLDTLGSSMTNLNLSSGFVSGVTTKGNKISILAFEVANTIVKGANLMQSLSKETIRHLKEVVLPSEGVQRVISKDMDELLRIAAVDKREELKVFSGEVVRFGNRCKDPQWHNLDRYFEKLGSEVIPQKQLKEEAETVMQQLMTLAQYTAGHDWVSRLLTDIAASASRHAPSCTIKGRPFLYQRFDEEDSRDAAMRRVKAEVAELRQVLVANNLKIPTPRVGEGLFEQDCGIGTTEPNDLWCKNKHPDQIMSKDFEVHSEGSASPKVELVRVAPTRVHQELPPTISSHSWLEELAVVSNKLGMTPGRPNKASGISSRGDGTFKRRKESMEDREGLVRQRIKMVFKEPIYILLTRIREKPYYRQPPPWDEILRNAISAGNLKGFVDQEKTKVVEVEVRPNPRFARDSDEADDAVGEDLPLKSIHMIGGPTLILRIGSEGRSALSSKCMRDWLHRIKGVASMLHQAIKFAALMSEETLYGDQVPAKQCYLVVSTKAAMKEDLVKVFEILKEHKLRLNPAKCAFGVSSDVYGLPNEVPTTGGTGVGLGYYYAEAHPTPEGPEIRKEPPQGTEALTTTEGPEVRKESPQIDHSTTWKITGSRMAKYSTIAKTLLTEFRAVKINQVQRDLNSCRCTDRLGIRFEGEIGRTVAVDLILVPSYETHLENVLSNIELGPSWMDPIVEFLSHDKLPKDKREAHEPQ
ncbi:similar to Ikzf5 [Actinidia rufa]|uniref:Similar to Ikzf5 n=1 Tax=Actinidia rufa TaxID=165716 RepID=A0A7J0GFQ9_9ERIC|nr:similar to Ikzf5 [Actinidia rufa]